MNLVKYLGFALTFGLFASSAFADIDLTVGGGERSMSFCGGTVEVNNGGSDNQLNIVFRRVENCSNVDFNGRNYEMSGRQGARNGSFTILMADDRRAGEHTQFVKLSSDSGAHFEDIYVHYRIVYR